MEKDNSEDVKMRTGKRVVGNSAFRNTLAASLARYILNNKRRISIVPSAAYIGL